MRAGAKQEGAVAVARIEESHWGVEVRKVAPRVDPNSVGRPDRDAGVEDFEAVPATGGVRDPEDYVS